MRSIVRPFAALALAGLLAAACGVASTPTPAPTPTAAPTATPTPAPTATPAPTPAPTATPAPATAGPPDQGVHVTGTEVVVALTDRGSTETVGGVEQLRGLVATTTDTTSDPRVSGSGTIGGNYDRWVGGATQWGTYRLENEGGSWEGTWAGIAYGSPGGPPIEDAAVWLIGAGGYAGLGYYFHFHGSNGIYEIDGLVFPGSPPAR
jgi:hypothetical protein